MEVSGAGVGGQAGRDHAAHRSSLRPPQHTVLAGRTSDGRVPSQTVICPPFNISKFENIRSGKSKLHSPLSCHKQLVVAAGDPDSPPQTGKLCVTNSVCPGGDGADALWLSDLYSKYKSKSGTEILMQVRREGASTPVSVGDAFELEINHRHVKFASLL